MRKNRSQPGDLVVLVDGQPLRNKPEFMYDSASKPALWYLRSDEACLVVASLIYKSPHNSRRNDDAISWYLVIVDGGTGWFFIRQYDDDEEIDTGAEPPYTEAWRSFKIIAKSENK